MFMFYMKLVKNWQKKPFFFVNFVKIHLHPPGSQAGVASVDLPQESCTRTARENLVAVGGTLAFNKIAFIS